MIFGVFSSLLLNVSWLFSTFSSLLFIFSSVFSLLLFISFILFAILPLFLLSFFLVCICLHKMLCWSLCFLLLLLVLLRHKNKICLVLLFLVFLLLVVLMLVVLLLLLLLLLLIGLLLICLFLFRLLLFLLMGCFYLFCYFFENCSLSTASAWPAGTFVSSAIFISSESNFLSSSFSSPHAFVIKFDFKELLHTISAKSLLLCAGVCFVVSFHIVLLLFLFCYLVCCFCSC